MKTKLPEVLRVKGVLYSYTDYPQGSIERAKALFADMWDKSQLTETVISGWDDAKARILKEKAWEKLGYPDPETVLREIFGERYDLVELGKVHLGPESLVTEAEEEGRKVLAGHGGDRRSEEAKADQVDIVKLIPPSGKGGNSAEYLKARLHRDRPDIATRVDAGEISARAGAIEAGIIKVKTHFEKVLDLLPKLTAKEKLALRRKLGAK